MNLYLDSVGWKRVTITGERTKHIVTLEGHTEITPGEDLFVTIPSLDDYSCLVLGSFHFLICRSVMLKLIF